MTVNSMCSPLRPFATAAKFLSSIFVVKVVIRMIFNSLVCKL